MFEATGHTWANHLATLPMPLFAAPGSRLRATYLFGWRTAEPSTDAVEDGR